MKERKRKVIHADVEVMATASLENVAVELALALAVAEPPDADPDADVFALTRD